jgi:hypothetical protein
MIPMKVTKILRARFQTGRIVTSTLTEHAHYEGQIQVHTRPDDDMECNGYAMSTTWDDDLEHVLHAAMNQLLMISNKTNDQIESLKVFKNFSLDNYTKKR